MSTNMSKDVGCPKCGAAVETQMWPEINAEENPDLRERILEETLFDWTCPECGYVARFLYPCLYHDPGRSFMIYMAPGGCEFHTAETDEKFPQLMGIKKRVVASVEELKEKILIFEAGLDDYAVELVKLALEGVLRKKYGKNTASAYFCYSDQEENKIYFAFFLEGSNEPIRRSTRLEAYEKSLEIVKSSELAGEENGFRPVDGVTAQKILEEYQEKDEAQ